MRLDDLQYQYPENLTATERRSESRIALLKLPGEPLEISKSELFGQFRPGDLLIINDTRVENRRIFAGENEILFVAPLADGEWEVLFPSRDLKVGESLALPGEITMTLRAKGLPQRVQLSKVVGEEYFKEYGEPALPPYIQRQRGTRHARPEDRDWYQSKWAEHLGSSAAPTASLHFELADLEILRNKGVQIETLTLHVGLGTFLPIKAANLNDHKMHSEEVMVSAKTAGSIRAAQARGSRIWALGTTVTRALEGWARGDLIENEEGGFSGATDIFIQPCFEFKVVNALLTNFHQPGSSLLALVAAFAGLEKVHNVYAWAIEKNFRLFSYGDLSVWMRP